MANDRKHVEAVNQLEKTAIINPGKADWIYDHEMGIHIPACSRLKWHGSVLGKCGQAPLVGEQIASGCCTDTGSHAAMLRRYWQSRRSGSRTAGGEVTP